MTARHPERFLRGGNQLIDETLKALRWIAQDLPEKDERRTDLLKAAYVLVKEQEQRSGFFDLPLKK